MLIGYSWLKSISKSNESQLEGLLCNIVAQVAILLSLKQKATNL